MGKSLLKCIQIVSEIHCKEINVKVIYIYKNIYILIEKFLCNGLSLVIASELLISIASIYYDLQWERAGNVLTVLPPSEQCYFSIQIYLLIAMHIRK